MVFLLYGANCTGKSSVADALAARYGATVVSGKDYLRLAKNEQDAWAALLARLRAAEGDAPSADSVVYVFTERPVLDALADIRARRVLFTADIDSMKARFALRMHGALPPPVAAMLERQTAAWADAPCDIAIDTTSGSGTIDTAVEAVLAGLA